MIEIRGGDYSAKIDLAHGGNCISLRNAKYDAALLREPPEAPQNPYLYGMPILFPVNRISGGRFTFEGREYVFPINEPATGCHLHGMLHATPFTLEEREENRVVCTYRANKAQPYLQFPHAFEIRMSYTLTKAGLEHRTTVKNCSEENMPVMLGFHTTFNALLTPHSRPEDIRVLVQIAQEYTRNMKNYLPTGEKPVFDAVSIALNSGSFDPFAVPTSRHYRSRGKGNMVIYDAGQNLSMLYENDEKLGFRLIYNGNADGYICLEPQTCLANCPNSPISREEAGFDYIAPGEEKQYVSRICMTEGDRR